jgi:hypothetical protein
MHGGSERISISRERIIAMRHAILAGVVPLLLGTLSEARAAPTAPGADSHLRPLVISQLPEPCRELARVPASAVIPDPDIAAHVSVANCWAEHAMRPLVLHPDAASIAALDQAAAPSLQIFDDVIEHAAARWKVIASTAKADLYRGMVVRMRSIIPGGDAPAGIQASLTTWLDRASDASRAAAEVARSGPVGDDPVVRANLRMIRDREQFDAAQAEVATDSRRFEIQAQRAAALDTAWHRAVAGGEHSEAETLMRAHFDAVHDERSALASLAQARSSLATARSKSSCSRL